MLKSPNPQEKDRPADRFADQSGYLVRVAALEDMPQVMALRAARFGAGSDVYDAQSLQIMVEYQGHLVATFRLRSFETGLAAQTGYTAQFYDLRPLASIARPVLELGRFCVAAGATQVDALRLSFAAMTRMVDQMNAALLFGCASFHGQELEAHRPALSLLKPHINAAYHVASTATQAIEISSLSHSPIEQAAALRSMPPLLRSYLSLGGWVGRHAVQDTELGTFHIFTALEIDSIPAARARAFRAMSAQITT